MGRPLAWAGMPRRRAEVPASHAVAVSQISGGVSLLGNDTGGVLRRALSRSCACSRRQARRAVGA